MAGPLLHYGAVRFLWFITLLASMSAATAADTNAVKAVMDRFEGGTHLLLSNTLPFVVSVRITAEMKNARPDYPLPGLFTVGPKTAIHAVTVEQNDPTKAWSLNWSFNFNLGHHRAKHDSNRVYRVPFRGRFRVTQGWNGNFSHNGWMRHAVDFTMPEGTDVCAARDGVVTRVVEHFTTGGDSPVFKTKANEIMIGHDDGTLTQYAHLQHNGAHVKVGDRVKAGQIIGLSGNTGFSTHPHLHFAVIRSDSATNYLTLPFRFPQGRPRERVSYLGER